MKSKCIKLILFGVCIPAILGCIVMLLWNYLMPVIFGLTSISFWQALGLLILSRILFGGIGKGKGSMGGWWQGRNDNPIHRKWKKMTPEQRKEFIEKRMRYGFGDPFDRRGFNMEESDKYKEDNE